MKETLSKINHPTTNDIWKMRAESLQYYRSCLVKFHDGKLFYPFGLDVSRSDLRWTVAALKYVLSSLSKDAEILSNNRVRGIYFDLNFKPVPIWHLDFSSQRYFINNWWQIDTPFHAFEVVGVSKTIEEGKMVRQVFVKGFSEPVQVDSAFYVRQFNSYLSEVGNETPIRPQFQCIDWKLILARELKTWSSSATNCDEGHGSSIVVPFRKPRKL